MMYLEGEEQLDGVRKRCWLRQTKPRNQPEKEEIEEGPAERERRSSPGRERDKGGEMYHDHSIVGHVQFKMLRHSERERERFKSMDGNFLWFATHAVEAAFLLIYVIIS